MFVCKPTCNIVKTSVFWVRTTKRPCHFYFSFSVMRSERSPQGTSLPVNIFIYLFIYFCWVWFGVVTIYSTTPYSPSMGCLASFYLSSLVLNIMYFTARSEDFVGRHYLILFLRMVRF